MIESEGAYGKGKRSPSASGKTSGIRVPSAGFPGLPTG